MFGLILIIAGVAASKEYGSSLFTNIVLVVGTFSFGFSALPLLINDMLDRLYQGKWM